MVNPIISGVKSRAHACVARLAKLAHDKINTVETICEGVKTKRRERPSDKLGAGVIGDITGLISKGADALGMGIKKKRRRKKGHGIVSTLAKSAAKAIAPDVVDAASIK